jgi:DNA-binding SARP family transcriptional activator
MLRATAGGALSAGSDLRIRLLGDFAAWRDGAVLDLGGPRQRAVLALLVLARSETVTADRIIEALWDDEPPASAFATLQSYVSHLRRTLEPDAAARTRSGVIVRQGRGYAALLPDDAVDARVFERLLEPGPDERDPVARLTAALALWRGPALADYADRPWALAEVTRLHELRSVARERLAAARVARGEGPLLVGDLEALVAEEPLREERWRLLALALYQAQRQADALSALRRARRTLADELGVDPGPALRALEADVLAQAPSLDAPGPPHPLSSDPGVRPPSVAPAAVVGRPAADLVDRDREVDVLRELVTDLRLGPAGATGRLLLEGPAGIGKSRLLEELRALAVEAGARVLFARASPLEQSYAYGVVRQLMEPVLDEALLTGAAAPARAVFDLEAEPGEGSLAVLHGLSALLAQVAATGPVVVCVDNLQWADPASLRYLAYVSRRLDGLPVLLATTVRTGEGDEHHDVLAELVDEGDVVTVRPQALCEGAVAALVTAAYGTDVHPLFVEACHRSTSGNPLLVRQLVKALVGDRVRPDAAHAHVVLAVGSRAVSSQVLMRLRRLPAQCLVVARSVAVLGDHARLPHVAAHAGLDDAGAASAVAQLTRAEMLRDDERIGFVHPVVAEVVYRDLPAAERGLQHERAAALLLAAGAPHEQVAAHLLLAPRRSSASTVDLLVAAARTAAERGATDAAATYLRRALDEPPDPDRRDEVAAELAGLGPLDDPSADALQGADG